MPTENHVRSHICDDQTRHQDIGQSEINVNYTEPVKFIDQLKNASEEISQSENTNQLRNCLIYKLDDDTTEIPDGSSEKSEYVKNHYISTTSQLALNNITHPKLTTKLNNYILPNNSTTIYHTNIHSLPHKHDLLNTHLDLLTNPPDIITLTDNMLPENINQQNYPIQQYKHIHVLDVSVYYRINLHISPLPNPNPIQDSKHIIIQIHTNEQLNNPTHTLINIYHRPRKNNDQFIKDLQTTIDSIQKKSPTTEFTIVGDININLLNLTPEHQFHNFLTENNLHTTITTPTRYDPTHNTATLIDTILTTMTHTETTAGTISPPLSDHLPIYTIFHNPTPRKNQKSRKTLTKGKYEKKRQEIDNKIITEITKMPPGKDTQEQTEILIKTLQQTIEKFKTTQKKKERRRQPWIKNETFKLIKKQHKLHQKMTHNPTKENKKEHKKIRNQLKKDIQAQKKEYFTTKINNTKHDQKRQSQILKTLLPSKKQQHPTPTTIIYENTTYTDPQDIANNMNDHFITVGHKTSKTINCQTLKKTKLQGDRRFRHG